MHQRENSPIGSTSVIAMPSKEAEVHAALGDVGRKLDLMQEQLGILIAKLMPVMRNEPVVSRESNTTCRYSAPIAGTLDIKSDQIGSMIHEINSAIDRLEI